MPGGCTRGGVLPSPANALLCLSQELYMTRPVAFRHRCQRCVSLPGVAGWRIVHASHSAAADSEQGAVEGAGCPHGSMHQCVRRPQPRDQQYQTL
jgi:hypothetical protein